MKTQFPVQKASQRSQIQKITDREANEFGKCIHGHQVASSHLIPKAGIPTDPEPGAEQLL